MTGEDYVVAIYRLQVRGETNRKLVLTRTQAESLKKVGLEPIPDLIASSESSNHTLSITIQVGAEPRILVVQPLGIATDLLEFIGRDQVSTARIVSIVGVPQISLLLRRQIFPFALCWRYL